MLNLCIAVLGSDPAATKVKPVHCSLWQSPCRRWLAAFHGCSMHHSMAAGCMCFISCKDNQALLHGSLHLTAPQHCVAICAGHQAQSVVTGGLSATSTVQCRQQRRLNTWFTT